MSKDAQRRRHSARRERLVLQLLPAVELLLHEGERYPQISVERLISAAAVSRTTFYRYFDDKAELLATLGERAIRDVMTATEALWQLDPDAGLNGVRHAVDEIVRVYLPHTQLLGAVNDLAVHNATIHAQYVTGFAAAQDAARIAITAGQRRGTVRADLDAASAAGWLTWMAERGMSQLVARADPPDRRQLVDTLAYIIWLTLYDLGPPAAREPPAGDGRRPQPDAGDG